MEGRADVELGAVGEQRELGALGGEFARERAEEVAQGGDGRFPAPHGLREVAVNDGSFGGGDALDLVDEEAFCLSRGVDRG